MWKFNKYNDINDIINLVKVIGCSRLRGGWGELGTLKNLNLWLQLVCIKLKLKQAIYMCNYGSP